MSFQCVGAGSYIANLATTARTASALRSVRVHTRREVKVASGKTDEGETAGALQQLEAALQSAAEAVTHAKEYVSGLDLSDIGNIAIAVIAIAAALSWLWKRW